MQASNNTCSSDLKQVAQQLLSIFAAPVIAQETSGPAAGTKYEVTTYNVSEDTFLYDHVKVYICWHEDQLLFKFAEILCHVSFMFSDA